MFFTKLLRLKKPEYNEPADIMVINENMDKIDESFDNLYSGDGALYIGYNNQKSRLQAYNVQDAINEIILMNPVNCTIEHELDNYPAAMVLEVDEGYGICDYGCGFYGGGWLREIKSTSVYHNRNAMSINVLRKVNGTPSLIRAGQNEFVMLYPDTVFFYCFIVGFPLLALISDTLQRDTDVELYYRKDLNIWD